MVENRQINHVRVKKANMHIIHIYILLHACKLIKANEEQFMVQEIMLGNLNQNVQINKLDPI